MDKERLEDIKEDVKNNCKKEYEFVTRILYEDAKWLISTVEELKTYTDYESEKIAKLNEFLQGKVKGRIGEHVIDVAMDLIEEQQKEIERLQTIEQAYEALKKSL